MILLFCRLLFVNNRILFSLFALVLFPLRDDKAPPIVRFPEDEEEATALELLLLFAETIRTVVIVVVIVVVGIVVVGIVLFTRSFSDSTSEEPTSAQQSRESYRVFAVLLFFLSS